MADGGAEFEWLNPVLVKELYFIIPIGDSCCPVGRGLSDALLVYVQILSNVKSRNLSAIRAIVLKETLVCMLLSN